MSVELPVATFREAAPQLRRPFTPEAVKFKVQATWPKQAPTAGMIVGYIDARLVIERLNLVIPDRWSDHYEQQGRLLVCHLTVDGLTRSDVGEGEGKALYSDALKRAAVKFGIGVSLYAIPRLTLQVGGGLKAQRDKAILTGDGERAARERYARWLASHGQEAFGEPLDHGDLDGSQGDAEGEEHSTPAASGVADAEQRNLIALKADQGKVSGDVLANILLVVTGNEPRSWPGEKEASEWATKALERLPAAKVDAVLENIHKESIGGVAA